MNFFNYTLVVFIFLALVLMVWLWHRLSNATGKLDNEIESLRKWQQEHQFIDQWVVTLEASVKSFPVGIALVDPQMNITLMNHAAEEILGHLIGQLKGQKYQAALPFLTEEGQSIYQQQDILLHVFEAREPLEHQHYQLMVSQSSHPVEVSWLPVLNDNGQILGAAIMFSDTTKQKQLEEMKVDFVSIVSHELRTPITAIKGYIDILLHETKLDPEHAEMLRRVYLSNERQLETVESMLNLSRLERGSIAIHPQAFHVEELIGQVIGEADPLAKQKGLELKFDYPRFALPQVWADPARAREVILNLCTNGIKYTDTGSVKVQVSAQADHMLISVTDTGPGIPPDVLQKLFEKFRRGESALTEQKQGMGLGLYISKQFVELMNGKIWCESTEGKGSTFYFTLPLK